MVVDRNGQYEVDGLLLGRGTPYIVALVAGMGVPEVKAMDRDLPGWDGGYAATDRLAPREVIFEVGLDGTPDTAGYDTLITDLGEVFAPRAADVTTRYQRFGRLRRFNARPRGLIFPWDDDFHLGAGRVACRLIAHDPIIYSDDQESVNDTGAFNVTNDGNYPVWPVITTDAGGTITLTNTTTGEAVTFTSLPSATIIDFGTRTAFTTVGAVDVYGAVNANPVWWQVEPGLNALDFSAAATITYRHGWTTG